MPKKNRIDQKYFFDVYATVNTKFVINLKANIFYNVLIKPQEILSYLIDLN